MPVKTLMFHMPEKGREDYYNWISSNRGCSIILISNPVAELVSKSRTNNSVEPLYKVIEILYGRRLELKFGEIFIIENGIFYLCEVVMPDDKFHHDFAKKFFGRNFAKFVTFEKIEVPTPASA